jgi:hypothetical protein
MSTTLRLGSLLLALLTSSGLAACGGDDDDSVDIDGGIVESDAQTSPVPPNNGALLDGDDVPGTLELARKELAIESTTAGAPFEIDEVWAIAASEGYIRFLFHFTNTSQAEHCFVQAETVTYLDDGGAAIGAPTGVFVFGSIRESAGVYTSTCLAIGESAWGVDIRQTDTPLETFAGVRVSLSVNAAEFSTPTTTLLPQSYTFAKGQIEVEAENSGVLPLSADFNIWVPLDDAGAPLTWGLLTPDTTPVPVGSSGFWALAFYGGTAAKVDIRFQFAEEAPPSDVARQRLRALDQAARQAERAAR